MKYLPIIVSFFMLVACQQKPGGPNPESEKAIRTVMAAQVEAWNKGDIDQFMEGYWKSDSILFIGSKMTHGWQNTLDRYKTSYPGKAAMGILRFEILRMDYISDDSYLITGKYFLTRENDAPSGIFTLLVKHIDGKWLIVYDHTS